ncbi:MAG TPA: hypothetical protein VK168_01140 [Saprospiraceae bacterium]|nr:hypothetical protein [Saprospiraceae bacterium]
MGLSILSGYILSQYGVADSFSAPIQALGTDPVFPFLSTGMFSHEILERPQFYDQHVISFAATYKNIEYEGGVAMFFLKWEKLLRQLKFDTAQLELQTEIMGTYRFFWRHRRNPDTLLERHQEADFQLIQTPDWYFGFGYRTRSGALIMPLSEDQIFTFDGFVYPLSQ